jgi:hypothetical protein
MRFFRKIKGEKRKMKSSKNKTTTAIAIFLILTITATLAALPVANAHTPALQISTWCYVSVSNTVIGVGQAELFVFWVNAIPPTATGAFGDRWTYTVVVTKPDGTNETLGPITSDPVGGGYVSYTPSQVGTYTVVAQMAKHVITGLPYNPAYSAAAQPGAVYVNDTFLAETSAPVPFIVQQNPIASWPEAPLPTQYWTRPINEANRNWDVLAGDWLGGAAQNAGPTSRFGYGTGPESAHVMWATPMWAGGMADARFGDIGYTTSHYEGLGFLPPPIILDEKIYYNVESLPRMGYVCLDLYAGKELWFFNSTGPVTGVSQSSSGSIPQQRLAFGQILDFECPNQHGTFPYLWSTSAPTANTWMMYDAFTGNYMCSIANVSATGTNVYGHDGSILYYNIVGTGANERLTVWNTTQAIWWRGTQQQYQNGDFSAFLSNDYWLWRPGLNVTYDGSHRFSLNASIPAVQGSILAVREDQYVVGGTTGKNNGTYVLQGNLWALNLKPDSNGVITPTLLWNITFTPPLQTADDISASFNSAGIVTLSTVDPEDGVFIFTEKATLQHWGYSLATGQLLWGPTAPENAFNYYGGNSVWDINVYQGELLTCGYGGQLRAYNITTGNILWNYNATNVGFESPYGGNYPLDISCIADGKIYLVSGEHSPTQPLWRGAYLRCVNASNGVELWKILHVGSAQTSSGGPCVYIGDGFLVGLNYYDNQIYCYGKGQSATTVQINDDVITEGNVALIKGTVMDTCTGAQAVGQKLGYGNEVPAVSDASMEAWMEYLYAQQAFPTNATGVQVTLDAIDPNGNFIHLGTTTSDMSGTFGYAWTTPDVPGKYTITATFAGSESYWASSAETYAVVSEAPPATAAPEYPQPIDYTWSFIGTALAIIIAVVLVGIWIRRK